MIDRIEGFWREVFRRRVLRTGAVYAAISFVILQLGEILGPAYGVGPGGLRTLFAALLAGCPPVLAVSWVYDISASGFRRTLKAGVDRSAGPVIGMPPPKGVIFAVASAAAVLGGLGWWLADGGVQIAAGPVSVPAMLVSGAVLVVVGLWSVYETDTLEPTPANDGSIAVLPFAYWGSAGEQAYLGEALADEIRNLLAGVDGLHVTARTSSHPNADLHADVRMVGRKLGVSTVLEGSVLRNGDHVRVTAQLIDTQTGFRTWSKTCACELSDLLVAHEEIARALVDGILACPDGLGKGLASEGTGVVDGSDNGQPVPRRRAKLPRSERSLGLFPESDDARPSSP